MRVLFIHGLEGSPQGSKATYLAERFDSVAPAMDTSDFEACVRVQREAMASHDPDVVVGSSFGGAVLAFLLREGSWRGPTLLLAPAAEKLGYPGALPSGVPVMIVHGLRDDVVPIEDSRRLVATGTPGIVQLLEVDDEHPLRSLVSEDRLAGLVRQVAAIRSDP